MSARTVKTLDAVTIRELFGSFDAEDEPIELFKEYFVTNNFYETFSSDFPLRIAVGNKGTGKSAVIKASYIDDMNRDDVIQVRLTASDLIEKADKLPADGLRAVNHWKAVFANEAASQILTSYISDILDGETAKAVNSLSAFFSWVAKKASEKTKGLSDIAIRSGVSIDRVKKIIFYIDDLDRGWDGRQEGLHFVSSMLNACYDISKRERNIQFRIALRWDLWDAVSRVNQDIDKIRQNVVFLRWSNHEIYVIVARRVSKYFGIEFDYRRYLSDEARQAELEKIFDPIIDRTFYGFGKWDNTTTRRVIMSMTRNRPRDLITLLTLAAEEANSKSRTKISYTDLQAIFPRYSEDRLNDLIVEFGTRLTGMEKLLLSFKPSNATGKTAEKFKFTNDKISTHVKSVLKDNQGKIMFTHEKGIPDFRRIIDFLYRIDFIQAWYRREDGGVQRVNFQDRQLAISDGADFGYSWEVLPAYRWGIQPTKVQDVIASLD